MTMNTERRKFIAGVGPQHQRPYLQAKHLPKAINRSESRRCLTDQTDAVRPEIHHWHLRKVLVSHYENNYVGTVKRLNAIGTQLAELDFAKAPIFVINGLKREELIASNSMILHEIYFDGLGGGARASGPLADAIARDFGSMERQTQSNKTSNRTSNTKNSRRSN
jgi:Fe-Mn family superoxide dismutase